jgi:hypothetical protein
MRRVTRGCQLETPQCKPWPALGVGRPSDGGRGGDAVTSLGGGGGAWRRSGRHDAAAGAPPCRWAAVVGSGSGGQVRGVLVVRVGAPMNGDKRSGAVAVAQRWVAVRRDSGRGQRGEQRRRRRR